LNESRTGFERHDLEKLTAKFDGASLELSDSAGWTSSAGNHAWDLYDASDFHYEFEEPVALDEFFDSWFSPLVFLITTGVRHRVRVEHFTITNRTWVSDEDGSPMDDVSLTVHVRNPHKKDRTENRTLHHVTDFDFSKQISIAFDVYRAHGDAMAQYLELIHSDPRSHRVKLIATAQMVESFDRSLTPDADIDTPLRGIGDRAFELFETDDDLAHYASAAKRSVLESVRPTFASRLSRLDQQTGQFVSELAQSKKWKNDVQLVRNTVVHGLPRVAFLARNVIPIEVATDILEVLFELRLLVAFGFTPNDAKNVMESDPNWWQTTQRIKPYMGVFREFEDFKA